MSAPTRGWDGLVRVHLSYATFGLIVQDGTVTDAAPISRRSVGRPIADVAAYYRGRGGDVAAVDETAETPDPTAPLADAHPELLEAPTTPLNGRTQQ